MNIPKKMKTSLIFFYIFIDLIDEVHIIINAALNLAEFYSRLLMNAQNLGT